MSIERLPKNVSQNPVDNEANQKTVVGTDKTVADHAQDKIPKSEMSRQADPTNLQNKKVTSGAPTEVNVPSPRQTESASPATRKVASGTSTEGKAPSHQEEPESPPTKKTDSEAPTETKKTSSTTRTDQQEAAVIMFIIEKFELTPDQRIDLARRLLEHNPKKP